MAQSVIDISAALKELEGLKKQAPQLVIQALETACVQVITKAREQGLGQASRATRKKGEKKQFWEDDTHRLRSSLGYVVYHNGVEVASNFQSTGGSAGGEGVQIGYAVAKEEAAKYPGIVAVVVAGADYASYVEAKGYDVLTGSALQLQTLFEAELRNLQLI